MSIAINKPSDRAMQCAEAIYGHFIKFPISRGDDHQSGVNEVARIIDAHYEPLVEALNRYLSMPSLDGKPERQELRKTLRQLTQ